jgi:Asp-tRNA(Asn)/Glu-tRNA(Gln) amidotransferase A subunit family amidase
MAGDRTAPRQNHLLSLGAVELRDRLTSGAVRAVEYIEACLTRIAEVESEVQAWAWLDGDAALMQARALDARRSSGAGTGPLHGLPVGLKDIIDTRGIPTENGTPIDAGRVPTRDATVVARLRAAGAIILGKTVCTEAALLHPGKTRNPHNLAHTPGGSSSGSAAAVAAGMVPLAIGTQTGGSVIRPAAYCGVVGLKPSFGQISRAGVLQQSPFLDTIGVFARSVEDAALLAETLAGHDPADVATEPLPAPRLLNTCLSQVPLKPVFAMVSLPQQHLADAQTMAAMEELAASLGDQLWRAQLPAGFEAAAEVRQRINFAEMAHWYAGLERRGRSLMSPVLTAAIDEGKAVSARAYLAALGQRDVFNASLDEIFASCDALLCPATPTAAPLGLEGTGSAIFNGLWTLCGTPAITLPVFLAENGLPMGVQLVGRVGDDARLLRTARWLAAHVRSNSPHGGTA